MIDEYVESNVQTATPYQLHLMVIDGAIRFAQAAETALAERKIAEAQRALDLARGHVGQLLVGLDAARFPQVVDKLKALFVFVLRNLVKADLKRDPRLVADSLTILRAHRETWLALAERLKQESAAAQVPAAPQDRFCWSS